MARGLCYPTGRDMPPGMQELAAVNWIREAQRILKEVFPDTDDGKRYFRAELVPLPEAVLIAEFNGSGVIVVDRGGQKWKDGKPWND